MKEDSGRIAHIVSLGCPRNRVESERMAGILAEAGWTLTPDPARARAIVVNTCGFIREAVDESIDEILALAEYRETGALTTLAVCGCLAARYGTELAAAMPEADVILSTPDLVRIAEALEEARPGSPVIRFSPLDQIPVVHHTDPRFVTTLPTAYVKIAEGCPEKCTFCIIPRLWGPLRSRDPEDVTAEVKSLVDQGAREIVLASQETTAYGLDRKEVPDFAGLLEILCGALAGTDTKIRFLYGHPARIPDRLLAVLQGNPAICSYLDVPAQHASEKILHRMGRKYGPADLSALFTRIREQLPEAILRTTLMTGFPGETQKDFAALCEFVEKTRFDHLGVFVYSDADDLPSHRLTGHVSQKTAEKRRDRLMEIQAAISLERNREEIGRTREVLVLGETGEEDYPYWGRTCRQAPDIDGVTYLTGDARPGQWQTCRVLDASEYDLFAEVS